MTEPGEESEKKRTARLAVRGAASVEEMLRRTGAAERLLEVLGSGVPAAKPGASRVEGEPGFVLHTYPWRESSLLLDALTASHGRVFLVARGAKRPASQWRGVLVPFAALSLSWSGKREAKMLVRARWLGSLAPAGGEALLSAFYVNEILMRLTVREDPQPGLFAAYARTLADLSAQDGAGRQRALRRFEVRLLRLLGWAATREGDSESFVVRDGVIVPAGRAEGGGRRYTAAQVEALLSGDFSTPAALRSARDILREMLQFHMGSGEIHTRRVLGELNRLGAAPARSPKESA